MKLEELDEESGSVLELEASGKFNLLSAMCWYALCTSNGEPVPVFATFFRQSLGNLLEAIFGSFCRGTSSTFSRVVGVDIATWMGLGFLGVVVVLCAI